MGKDWKKDGNKIFEWPLTLQYRGEYDYDGLMELIRSYFASVKMDKLDEPKFKYKVGGGGKAEVEFKLEGEVKVSGYTKVKLVIEGHLWSVERGKPSNGKIDLKIQTFFLSDYAGSYDGDSKLKKWMHKKINNPSVGEGLAFGDIKAEGKKNGEKIGNTLLAKIKKFIGVECV